MTNSPPQHPQSSKYKISTIKEITDIITEDNFEVFGTDFLSWLTLVVKVKRLKSPNVNIQDDHFDWIDDGKNDISVGIKFTNPK